jgi:hypothetical protein
MHETENKTKEQASLKQKAHPAQKLTRWAFLGVIVVVGWPPHLAMSLDGLLEPTGAFLEYTYIITFFCLVFNSR